MDAVAAPGTRLKNLGALGLLCLAIAGLMSAPPAAAQAPGEQPAGDWRFAVGAAVFGAPEYEGANEYQVRAFPSAEVRYRDLAFLSVREGLGWVAVRSDRFRAGPLIKYRFEREEDDSPALSGLGDVEGTIEAGGFAELDVGPVEFVGEVRQGLNGHEGLIAETGLSWGRPVLDRLFFAISPHVTWADADYTNAYFGISPAQAAASGYPVYAAGSGFKDIGVRVVLACSLSDRWALSFLAGVKQLLGDAADSPLVEGAGSQTQGMAALSLTYKFSL
jgi:outer membrane protein